MKISDGNTWFVSQVRKNNAPHRIGGLLGPWLHLPHQTGRDTGNGCIWAPTPRQRGMNNPRGMLDLERGENLAHMAGQATDHLVPLCMMLPFPATLVAFVGAVISWIWFFMVYVSCKGRTIVTPQSVYFLTALITTIIGGRFGTLPALIQVDGPSTQFTSTLRMAIS